MAHENEYITPSASKRHRQTWGRMSLKDKKEEEEEEERRYRETMAYAAGYMEKIRSKRAPRTHTSYHSSPMTSDDSDDEIRTPITSLFSTSNAGNVGNGGQPARLATSSSGGIRPGRLSFRPSNANSLSNLANKNTISKDNTTGDEVREAEILANMGKKICNTLQQVKKAEAGDGGWRNRDRRVRKGLNPPHSDPVIKDLANPDANQLDELDQFSYSPTKPTVREAEVDPFSFWGASKKSHKPKKSKSPEPVILR